MANNYNILDHASGTISGTLQHTGTLAGLYGATPVARAAALTNLTDSTGGTANDTLVDVTTAGLADPAKVNSDMADLAAKVNALITALRNLGVITP